VCMVDMLCLVVMSAPARATSDRNRYRTNQLNSNALQNGIIK
jgi:hypothetical protein